MVQLNKERIMDSIEIIMKNDSQLSRMIAERRNNKEALIEQCIVRQFLAYCGLIRLVNAQFTIEHSLKNQLAIIFVTRKLEDFFWKYVMRISQSNLKKWDSFIMKESLSRQDADIIISRQIIFGQKLHLFEQQRQFELNNQWQKKFRQEAKRAEDLANSEAEKAAKLKTTIMDIDDACTIVQCAERMYQALTRHYYLMEVRKKALDLHADKKEFDPERSIVLIQARTRGLLARKKIQKMREKELKVLGLSAESLHYAKMSHREMCQNTEASQIHAVLSIGKIDFNNKQVNFRLPESLTDYLESLRSDFFMTDPFRLTTDSLMKATASSTERIIESEYLEYNQETESHYTFLINAGICRTTLCAPTFDELASFDVDIKVNRKQMITFDLRNFLCLSAVIPYVIAGWPNLKKAKHNGILIIGAKGSGKSVWAKTIADKCGALRITLSNKVFLKQNRNKIFNHITQFVRRTQYCVVLFDRLEVFQNDNKDKRSHQKKLMRSILHLLVREDKCLPIGMSRISELEFSVADLFNMTIYMPDSHRK